MMILAYLRDGRVYANKGAWEHGLDHAPYRIVMSDPPIVETRIAGTDYVGLWCWDLDAKHPYGAVPLAPVAGSRRP